MGYLVSGVLVLFETMHAYSSGFQYPPSQVSHGRCTFLLIITLLLFLLVLIVVLSLPLVCVHPPTSRLNELSRTLQYEFLSRSYSTFPRRRTYILRILGLGFGSFVLLHSYLYG